ncbi:MAG: DUF6145 family protein [Marvinbryantia sp.]|jgi:hypothetical protein
MYKDKVVLCAASAYNEKFYFNDDFASLPDSVQDELKILCVLYTQDVGGVLSLEFDEEGNLDFHTEAASDDFSYDEIGSVLKIREIQRNKKELLESLEMYYRIFFMNGEQNV